MDGDLRRLHSRALADGRGRRPLIAKHPLGGLKGWRMNFRAMIFPPPPATPASVGLLVLRGFAGIALATHGWGKMQDPFHWLDKAEHPPPGIFQFLAAFSEFFGGLALI